MTFYRFCPDAETQKLSHQILATYLRRISGGDPVAMYDLAVFWMMHVFDHDPEIEFGIVEGMMRQAAQRGNEKAADFLVNLWPVMRPLLMTRRSRSEH
jgi:hypothetical protein